ncbi:MAG: flavodoxin family protein [Clostridia bacterium]|nr:flavodoxin family protein [Clostridia bacterium]
MKVVLINGSPHKEGCTHRALREIADTLEKNGVECAIRWLGTDPVAGCRGCGACAKIGKCIIEDAVNRLAPEICEADGVVFGSPVHYAAASGTVTAFMDRLFYSSSKRLAGKPACAVFSCRRGGASAAFDQLNKYFTISSMPIVSGQYWNMVHGSKAEDVEKDEEGLQVMRSLGRNMAWLLACIEAGKEKGITFPEKEAPIRTNFIR